MINSEIYIPIYFKKQCITEHDDFGAVVFLWNVLWTALVGLHDRESRGLPLRDSSPNWQFHCSNIFSSTASFI